MNTYIKTIILLLLFSHLRAQNVNFEHSEVSTAIDTSKKTIQSIKIIRTDNSEYTINIFDTHLGTAPTTSYSFINLSHKFLKNGIKETSIDIIINPTAKKGETVILGIKKGKETAASKVCIIHLDNARETPKPSNIVANFNFKQNEETIAIDTSKKTIQSIKIIRTDNSEYTIDIFDTHLGTALMTSYKFSNLSYKFLENGIKETSIDIIINPTAKKGETVILGIKKDKEITASKIYVIHLENAKIKPNLPNTVANFNFEHSEEVIAIDTSKKIIQSIKIIRTDSLDYTISVFDTHLGTAPKTSYSFSNIDHNFLKDGTKETSINITINPTAKKGETVILGIKKDKETATSKLCVIHLDNAKEKVTRLTGFFVAAGANFDFIDGLQASNAAYEMNVFLPNKFGIKLFDINKGRKKDKFAEKRWGITGNLYRNRYVTKLDMLDNQISQKVVLPPPTPNVYTIKTSYGQVFRSIQSDNLGGNLSLLQRIGQNKTDSDNFETYMVYYFEGIRRDITNRIDSMKVDTTVTSTSPINSRLVLRDDFRTVKTELWNGYFGLGVLMNYYNDDIDLRIKPILCLANLDKIRPSFIVNFNLIEKNSGIRLGGEIRGLLDGNSLFFTVYAQKVLNIKDFLSPIFKKLGSNG